VTPEQRVEKQAELLRKIVLESSYLFVGHEGQEPYLKAWVTIDSKIFISEVQALLIDDILDAEEPA
jgi:hypothetical protein